MSKYVLKDTEKIKAAMAPIALDLQRAAEKMKPVVAAYVAAAEKAYQKFAPVILEIQKTSAIVIKQAQKWQEEKKILVSKMAEQGWFPNWYTFLSHSNEEDDSLDNYMVSHIDDCWDEIKNKMYEFCPNRKHVFDAVFRLHEEKNYIASIPLIFTQADGVCGEEFSYFFSADPETKKRASDEIVEKYEGGEIRLDIFTEFLLEPFKTRLQVANGSSKCSQKFKSKGPNRHGILHGSRKHLDYGTEINGYKAISFLAFLIYTTKDAFKEKNEGQI